MLVNAEKMLKDAKKGKYAVAQFNKQSRMDQIYFRGSTRIGD